MSGISITGLNPNNHCKQNWYRCIIVPWYYPSDSSCLTSGFKNLKFVLHFDFCNKNCLYSLLNRYWLSTPDCSLENRVKNHFGTVLVILFHLQLITKLLKYEKSNILFTDSCNSGTYIILLQKYYAI